MVVSPDKTVNSYLNSPTGEGSSMGKDVFYRLKNSPFICWRMLMWYFVHRFLKVTSNEKDVGDTSSRCLIFDDTTLSKTGKSIEKIGKVWDHVTNRYMLGFKLMVMMYWDGKSSIPLDFGLHREKAETTISMIAYLLLTLRFRYDNYEARERLGDLAILKSCCPCSASTQQITLYLHNDSPYICTIKRLNNAQ